MPNTHSIRLRRRHLAVAAAISLAPTIANAALVAVGTHNLLANSPNQKITIQVTGGEQIAGEDLFAQIGDGGPINGGTNTKPIFTNVDIITSTIFVGNNSGAQGDPNGIPPGSNAGHPLIWLDSTVTNTGTVPANGLLATLTIDTTGVNSGTFSLLLTGVANTLGSFNTTLRASSGDPIPLTVTNGRITVVTPEPASGMLGVAGMTLLLSRRKRRIHFKAASTES